MKMFLTALILISSFSSHATSILRFKTERECQTVKKVKGNELLIDVQKAQDGQAQLVLKFEGQQEQKVQVKEILPPRMAAGAPTTYVGKDLGTDNKIVLTISSGTAPIKVGKVVGRSSKLTIEHVFSDLAMVCTTVTK